VAKATLLMSKNVESCCLPLMLNFSFLFIGH
jgi:hypothetical protein